MSYPNQPPLIPGNGGDEHADERGGDIAAGDPDVLTGDDDRPLDPDVDDDAIVEGAGHVARGDDRLD